MSTPPTRSGDGRTRGTGNDVRDPPLHLGRPSSPRAAGKVAQLATHEGAPSSRVNHNTSSSTSPLLVSATGAGELSPQASTPRRAAEMPVMGAARPRRGTGRPQVRTSKPGLIAVVDGGEQVREARPGEAIGQWRPLHAANRPPSQAGFPAKRRQKCRRTIRCAARQLSSCPRARLAPTPPPVSTWSTRPRPGGLEPDWDEGRKRGG